MRAAGDKAIKTETLLPIAVIVLLASLYFFSALNGNALLTERDLSVFFIQPRLLWVDIIKNGEFPLWNPYSFSGHPLFATLQPGVLYPVNILLLLLPFDIAFNWTIIIHFMLAGIFSFFLLRELKAGPAGALAGSLTFMLSGYMFSVHNVISTLFTVAWSPLAVLVTLRITRNGSVRNALFLAIVFTLMFLGGGIEALFATICLSTVISFFPSVLSFQLEQTVGLKKRIGLLCLAMAAFLSLSAVQLLPFLELADHSIRAGGLSFFEATTWSFDFKDFIQFFIPDPYGYGVTNAKYWSNQSWLKTVYLGAIPFILSVFFILKAKRRALPLALTALVFLVPALGKNTGLYQYLFEFVPFMDKIRYPVKFLFVFFLFISITAGLGLDSLRQGLEGKAGRHRAIIHVLLGLSTVAALCLGYLSYFGPEVKEFLVAKGMDYPEYNYAAINIFNTKRALFFFITASVCLYAGLESARFRKALPYAVVFLLAIDLFFAHNGYYHETDSLEYHKKGESLEFLSKDEGLYRIFVTPKTMKQGSVKVSENGPVDQRLLTGIDLEKTKATGYNLEHRVFDTWGLEVMRRGDYSLLYELLANQKGPASTNILQMLNVKYVISIPGIDSGEFRLVKVIGAKNDSPALEDTEAPKIYEHLNTLPRFYVTPGFRIVKKPDEYIRTFLDKGFSPAREVLLEEDPGIKPVGKALYGVDVVSYKNNSVLLNVATETGGMLVASEGWYPGWKAYVDGKEAKLLKADLVLRAIPLAPGAHSVRFVYCPASFKTGLAISSVSAVLIIFSLSFPFFKGRRPA